MPCTCAALRLAPVVKQPGDLEKWLEALKPHNPNMVSHGIMQSVHAAALPIAQLCWMLLSQGAKFCRNILLIVPGVAASMLC